MSEVAICFMCKERDARVRTSPTLSGPDKDGYYTVLPMCATCFYHGDVEKWVKAEKKRTRQEKQAQEEANNDRT